MYEASWSLGVPVSAQRIDGHKLQWPTTQDSGVVDEPGQRFAGTADQNRGPRLLNRFWHTECFGESVVLALEGPVVCATHLLADLKCLLHHLESFADRRKGFSQSCVFPLVPRGAASAPGMGLGHH